MNLHDRPRLIWLILVSLTLGSITVFEAHLGQAFVILTVFGIAVIKAQLIATYFMETGKALPAWNATYRVWIFVIGLILIGGHVLGR